MNAIITIDGPAGAGKSTISRLLAKELDYLYLDTGAMYRAVALQAQREGIYSHDGEALMRMCRDMDIHFFQKNKGDTLIFIGNENVSSAIRTPEMDMLASDISAIQEVRQAMTDLQRKIGETGRLVAEGRDMGTVVFPDAKDKFFITASTKARAERRYKERIQRGESVLLTDVEAEMVKRDEQDRSRTIAPLQPADDAVVIDTSMLDINQVIQKIHEYLKV
ncbi:MAG: (d)CMP kinase [Deltaproteobacteria bacterium]|nr:(d)CMP kinase [Deltaproteobacteria bacterium]